MSSLLLFLSLLAHAENMTLRDDGRLTGPGTITFEAENRGGPKQGLTILGIVHGKTKVGTVQILKSTEAVAVIPAQPSIFKMRITDEEWAQWSPGHTSLHVGFTFPQPEDADRWQYQNLLKPEEALRQPAGEFRVKGAFKPRY